MFHIIVSFFYIYISQGSVATHFKCGGVFNNFVIANFSTECASEISFKIGQYLTKIRTEVSWQLFMAHGVVVYCTSSPGKQQQPQAPCCCCCCCCWWCCYCWCGMSRGWWCRMSEAVVVVSQRLSPLLSLLQPLNSSFYRNSLKVSVLSISRIPALRSTTKITNKWMGKYIHKINTEVNKFMNLKVQWQTAENSTIYLLFKSE